MEDREALLDEESIWFKDAFEFTHGSRYVAHFGGKEDCIIDAGETVWTRKDEHIIKSELNELVKSQKYPSLCLADFAPTLEGTIALYAYLQTIFIDHTLFRKYMLALILYHQLQYKRKVIGYYSTGYPA
jgi:hypothetical protein